MLLMIDNYDSFTYNLVQYFAELGEQTRVRLNDKISLDEIEQLHPERIVISPGPGTPDAAGISVAVIEYFQARLPILGVCLGHQCIAQAAGGRIIHADQIMHGKTAEIHHQGWELFHDLESPFTATRYHSLVVDKDQFPECLEVSAWTQDSDGAMDEIMGLRHRDYPLYGVQFHPESILSSYGHALLGNFLACSG